MLKKRSKMALIGINLDTVQLLASITGSLQSGSDEKAAEVLSRLCADNRMLFHARENRFAFYIYDYKDKNELSTSVIPL